VNAATNVANENCEHQRKARATRVRKGCLFSSTTNTATKITKCLA